MNLAKRSKDMNLAKRFKGMNLAKRFKGMNLTYHVNMSKKIACHQHVKGYLYVLYHDTFQQYVDTHVSCANEEQEVYKLGWTIDPQQRLKDYTTSFLTPCKFLFVSGQFEDGYRAERILFYLLRRERLSKYREFFNVSLDRVIAIIQRLEGLQSQISFVKLYAMMCMQCIPFKVLTQLSQLEEAVEYVDRLIPKEFDRSCNLNDYLEQFRYKPKDIVYARNHGYLFPEEADIQMLVRSAEQHKSTCIFNLTHIDSDEDEVDTMSDRLDTMRIG